MNQYSSLMKKACHGAMTSFLIFFLLFETSAFARFSFEKRCHPDKYRRCPPVCYYYYGYDFPASMYDYEVDNACVDFCIDKKHRLQECTRACSNYTRPLDYPPECV